MHPTFTVCVFFFLDHPLGDLSVHADAAPDGEKFLLIIGCLRLAVSIVYVHCLHVHANRKHFSKWNI